MPPPPQSKCGVIFMCTLYRELSVIPLFTIMHQCLRLTQGFPAIKETRIVYQVLFYYTHTTWGGKPSSVTSSMWARCIYESVLHMRPVVRIPNPQNLMSSVFRTIIKTYQKRHPIFSSKTGLLMSIWSYFEYSLRLWV